MPASLKRGARSLTRIEMIMVLQGVDLLRYCSAAEVLRISAICQERNLAADQLVYETNDEADFLYVLASGEVQLEENGKTQVLKPNDSFGVLEILSGRLRGSSAKVTEDSKVLAISSSEFFDLLSNNIEIVKALFREVLQTDQRA